MLFGDAINSGDNFINSGKKDTINNDALKNVSDTLFNVFLTIGVVVALVIAGIIRNTVYDSKCRRKSKN